MKYLIQLLTWIGLFASCNNPTKQQAAPATWKYNKTISLDSLGPVGIALDKDENLFITDADNNRIIKMNPEGKLLQIFENFDRPMHVSWRDTSLFIAEYGADEISKLSHDQKETLASKFEFDAISGVDEYRGSLYAADFYNHRVTCQTQDSTFEIGSKGKENGQFTYPTDIQIENEKIYVADAYNHRVQVFGLDGKHLLTVGEAEKINAATGLFVTKNNIFITDFENSRILVYDLNGLLIQVLNEGLDKPADVIAKDSKLLVVNYHGRSISQYDFQ